MNTLHDPKVTLERYISAWHEPDAAKRRALIEQIWCPDGAHLSATKEARGYEQLETRIADTYEHWVVNEQCSFRGLGEPQHHHDAISFRWEMISDAGQTESIGRDLIIIDADGRFRCVYQFIED